MTTTDEIYEKWKPIKGYEGIYEVSSLGRIKSLARKIANSRYGFGTIKEKILKSNLNTGGYLTCVLCNKTQTNKQVHQLVATTFLGHIPDGHKNVVDHINGNKLDNRVENLQIVTQRDNLQICFIKEKIGFSSKYHGVSWNKQAKKWITQIKINGRNKYLGLYHSELEASAVYQAELNNYKNSYGING